MKFSFIVQLALGHLYPQILFPVPSLSENEAPHFHRTNIRAFQVVLVEERREQLCMKADAVSYRKRSCNFVPATVRASNVP